MHRTALHSFVFKRLVAFAASVFQHLSSARRGLKEQVVWPISTLAHLAKAVHLNSRSISQRNRTPEQPLYLEEVLHT